ncbi:MAG: hypothetical protein HY550_07415 [Elusimicrobia bacterium]|nr:hypothetical protein [Elusimicrobiota bacterium]
MRTFVKTTFAALLAGAAACAHAPAPGSFKADPEPLTAEGSAAYDARDPGASRERASLDAQKSAVRRAAELFMDETAKAGNYGVLEIGLLKTPQLYTAKTRILSEGQDGASYRVRARVWVYHGKIASALRGMNLAGSGAAAVTAALAVPGQADKSFASAFKEVFARSSPIVIKDLPFSSEENGRSFIKGGSSEEAPLSGPEPRLLEAAAAAGADLLFSASASAASSGAGLSTGFYPSRSEAALKIYEVGTGRELVALSSQASAIDSSIAASFSKSLASAGELLAQAAAGRTDRLVKQAFPVRVKVLGLGGLEELEKLRAQLLRLDLKGLRLESYSDGAAVFTAVPRRSDPQEFASTVLRGDSLGLELDGAGAQEVVFSLHR